MEVLYSKCVNEESLKICINFQAIFRQNTEPLNMEDFTFPLVPFRKLYKVDPPLPFKSLLNFHDDPSYFLNENSSNSFTKTPVPPKGYFTGKKYYYIK